MASGKLKILYGLMLCLPVLLAGTCKQTPASSEKELAKVHDKYLYPSDLAGMGAGLSVEDSLRLVVDFIDNWVRRQLIIKIAEENLSEQLPDIEKQALDYRESLLIYAYEEGLINEKLDTVVSEIELEDYFEQNKNRFFLKDDIYSVDYVILPQDAPYLDSVKQWFGSSGRYREEIDAYCMENCIDYFIDSDLWFSLEDLLRRFPGITLEQSQLQSQKPLEISGTGTTCLLMATDKRTKDRPGPLAYFKSEIEKLILNKRKKELIKNWRQDIYLDGKKRSYFEIYDK